MIDCGASKSAAPVAVVRGLISAALTQDKGAKIELEQSVRFGNGRWGRALCRVHLRYALPNPDNCYKVGV